MPYDSLLVALIIFTLAYGTIGWLGYWTEYQNRVKLEKQIKQFYNGTEKEDQCGTTRKYQQIIQKVLLKAREITDTRIF